MRFTYRRYWGVLLILIGGTNISFSQEQYVNAFIRGTGFRHTGYEDNWILRTDLGITLLNDYWISPSLGFSYLSARQTNTMIDDTDLTGNLFESQVLEIRDLNYRVATFQLGTKVRLMEKDSYVWPVLQTTLHWGQATATVSQQELEEAPDLYRQTRFEKVNQPVFYPVFSAGLEGTPFGSERWTFMALVSYSILSLSDLEKEVRLEGLEDVNFDSDLSTLGFSITISYKLFGRKQD